MPPCPPPHYLTQLQRDGRASLFEKAWALAFFSIAHSSETHTPFVDPTHLPRHGKFLNTKAHCSMDSVISTDKARVMGDSDKKAAAEVWLQIRRSVCYKMLSALKCGAQPEVILQNVIIAFAEAPAVMTKLEELEHDMNDRIPRPEATQHVVYA